MKSKILLMVLTLISLFPLTPIKAESFQWPSSGYLGWIYKFNNGYHNGVDIWSNTSGGWDNNITGKSAPVYPASSGHIVRIFTAYPKGGYRIKHSDSLYTNYWHVKDLQKEANINVTSNDLLGYQDNDVTVHLHLTVASGDNDTGIDPSGYFNLQLNATQAGSVGWMHPVKAGILCDQNNVLKSNWTINVSTECKAYSDITIMPESFLSTPSGEIKLFIS